MSLLSKGVKGSGVRLFCKDGEASLLLPYGAKGGKWAVESICETEGEVSREHGREYMERGCYRDAAFRK